MTWDEFAVDNQYQEKPSRVHPYGVEPPNQKEKNYNKHPTNGIKKVYHVERGVNDQRPG